MTSTLGGVRARGTKKEDEVRTVALILHCGSFTNVDKGEGVQISENFADVIYE